MKTGESDHRTLVVLGGCAHACLRLLLNPILTRSKFNFPFLINSEKPLSNSGRSEHVCVKPDFTLECIQFLVNTRTQTQIPELNTHIPSLLSLFSIVFICI